jgi:hypothetical protein
MALSAMLWLLKILPAQLIVLPIFHLLVISQNKLFILSFLFRNKEEFFKKEYALPYVCTLGFEVTKKCKQKIIAFE